MISVPDETEFFHFVYARRWGFGRLEDVRNRARLVDAYLATERIRRLNLDVPELRRTLMAEATSYPSFLLTLLRFCAASRGKQIAGEKTASHAVQVARLLEWFPGCRIIHLVRDPRDTAASMMQMPWAPKSALASARTWRRSNESVLACSGSEQYLRLRYEDLVAAPEDQLRRVCAHLGVDYCGAMLQQDDSGAGVRWWSQRAHKPVTRGRVQTWRSGLDPWQASLVEDVAALSCRSSGTHASARRRPSLCCPGVWWSFGVRSPSIRRCDSRLWLSGYSARVRSRRRRCGRIVRTEPMRGFGTGQWGARPRAVVRASRLKCTAVRGLGERGKR